MKDYLHLFGGMGAAIVAHAIYIFAFGAVMRCFAEERITYPASDGVNEVTARVRDDGVVIPESVTLAYVEPPPREKVTVYRLELHSDAQGNEAAYVVGGDGVSRPVVLVEPMEYKLLTERLDAVWQSFHATAAGRRKLHGKIERTEIDEKAMQKVEVHADGYRHTEAMPKRERPAAARLTRLQAKIEKQKPKGMSDKQWEMRKAFERHRKGVPKTVTVEHDAATGKDTVVK
ncbi:MAG: hypothetical protein IKQ17_05995 [Kiritimatiellae bacterium]|nr:hypothetical protein [Kiritimatiellia bacterium]